MKACLTFSREPETGREIWKYNARSNGRENRGVAYWPGDQRTPARILVGTGDGRLIALDAKSGKPADGFGDNGVVNLRAGVTGSVESCISEGRRVLPVQL